MSYVDTDKPYNCSQRNCKTIITCWRECQKGCGFTCGYCHTHGGDGYAQLLMEAHIAEEHLSVTDTREDNA